MRTIFLLLSLLITKTVLADVKVVELRSVHIDYMKFTFAKEPFMANYPPTNRLDLHLDTDWFNGVGFINNMVHSETDKDQYRKIGWNYRMGAHLGKSVDVYYEHFSQHLLDATIPMSNSYDAVGVRLYLYQK